jgi:hypothetical protein
MVSEIQSTENLTKNSDRTLPWEVPEISEIWSGAQKCRRCLKWKIRRVFLYGRFSLPYCNACADSLHRRRRRERLNLPSYLEMKLAHERAVRRNRQSLAATTQIMFSVCVERP